MDWFGKNMSGEPTVIRPEDGLLQVYPLDDFEDFRLIFGKWGGQFQQISRGRFKGVARVYAGSMLRAFHVETNQAIFTRGLDRKDWVTIIPITALNESTLWRGRRVPRGRLLVKGPEVEYYNQTSRDTVIRALLVPVHIIERMTGPAADVLVGRRSSSSVAVSPMDASMFRFEAALDDILNPSEPITSIVSHQLELACLDRLADCLLDRRHDVKVDLLRTSRLELLNQAMDIMHRQLEKGLNARQLCAELKVNDRILRRVFKDSFGAGPIVFFRLMRMNALRRSLKSERSSGRSVAALARRYGFTRLGTLAAEYRTQFGELPSETLGVRGHKPQ